MKAMEWKIAGLAMAIIGAASMAQAEQGQGKGKGQGGGRKLPPHVIEQFDTDGDGQLNEEERAAAKEARKAAMQKFDADGDGQLNEEERETMRTAMGGEGPGERGKRPEGEEGKGNRKKGGHPQMTPEQRQEMMEKYDADGDGQLNEEERAALRKDMEGKRGERPEGEKGQKGKGRHKPTPEQRKAMMEKYDADGDGQLSEKERETMRADWKKKQSEEK